MKATKRKISHLKKGTECLIKSFYTGLLPGLSFCTFNNSFIQSYKAATDQVPCDYSAPLYIQHTHTYKSIISFCFLERTQKTIERVQTKSEIKHSEQSSPLYDLHLFGEIERWRGLRETRLQINIIIVCLVLCTLNECRGRRRRRRHCRS